MTRPGSAVAAILVLSCGVAWGTSPTGGYPASLSEHAPLCVSNVSTFGENTMESEVHRELLQLAFFGVFDHLEFAVHGDTVILHGQVFHPDLKYDAAEVVAGIPGVEQVINLITFLPDSPADNRVRIAVFTAIYGHSSMSIYTTVGGGGAIHVVVQSGRVVLEGQVGSIGDARRAAGWARAVPGVVSVTSHLTVSH
jgi:hyperosmotically inducible periplasmic protein